MSESDPPKEGEEWSFREASEGDEEGKEGKEVKWGRWAQATKHAGLKIPVRGIHRRFVDTKRCSMTKNASVFFTAVLEYVVAEVLDVSGNAVKACHPASPQIGVPDLARAILADPELLKLVTSDENAEIGSDAATEALCTVLEAYDDEHAQKARGNEETERLFEEAEGMLNGLSLSDRPEVMTEQSTSSPPQAAQTAAQARTEGEGYFYMLYSRAREEGKRKTDGYLTA